MKIISLLTLLFISASCSQKNPESKTKILDFGVFTIETPSSWKKVKEPGFDSYVGRIAIDNNDTLDFDLGWYSNNLSGYSEGIIERSALSELLLIDTTGIIIVDNIPGFNLDEIIKNSIVLDTVDGRKTKIIFPIKSGKGVTGIYIDSLWQSGSDVDRFNLYGTDLKPENERVVLQALRTLKFYKKKNNSGDF